ncbi:MAG TPA: protein kinase, partial [Phycisphaerales bacterium]|nr:protein kinase [Phycisphaerales bacterium]
MAEPQRQTDLTETNPLAKSGETPAQGSKAGAGSRSGEPAANMGSTGPTVPTTEEVLQEVAKAASNIDSIVGRLVIENNFATPEEVQNCLQQSRGVGDNSRSLVELLVDNEYITRRQMERLREAAAAERSGKNIPGYKFIEKLGAGAMATVWKAKQISLNRTVAVKILPKKFSTNKQFIERFYAEGRAAAQLNHPNIVQ